MFKSLARLMPPEYVLLVQLFIALLWIAALAIVLTGCSLIAPSLGPQLAKGVNRYCEQPAIERALLRDSINAQIAPHRVELTCVADLPVPDE